MTADLVLYLARHLVSEPDAVRVEAREGAEGELVLDLHVADADRGLVIGRGGRMVNALRTIARAAGAREDRRVLLDVADSG